MRQKQKHGRKEVRTDLLLGISREQPDFALAKVEQKIDEVSVPVPCSVLGCLSQQLELRAEGSGLYNGAHGNHNSAKSLQSKLAQTKA